MYVSTDLNDETLWKKEGRLQFIHWINEPPAEGSYLARIRHRAPLEAVVLRFEGSEVKVMFQNEQRAVAAGQSIVFYSADRVLGGGIVA